LDFLPNTAGHSPSWAAAIGTWPISKVQPLSAPMDETMMAIEIAMAQPHPT
jgi:hypothetical protein